MDRGHEPSQQLTEAGSLLIFPIFRAPLGGPAFLEDEDDEGFEFFKDG
jgi:hypothetical protein